MRTLRAEETPTSQEPRRRTRQCDEQSYGYRREFLDARLELKRLLDNAHFRNVMEFLLRDLKPGYGRPATGLRLHWKDSSVLKTRAASTMNRWVRWAAERGHLDRKYDGRTLWYFMPDTDDKQWRFWRQMAGELHVAYLLRAVRRQ